MATETEGYDWSDIVPIPQDDCPNPVASISYAPECMDVFFPLNTMIFLPQKSLFRYTIDGLI